jgi:hypothetical protein
MNANDIFPKRMWINQPSTLQPDHDHHGKNVIISNEPYSQFYRAHFLSGPVVSMLIASESLSEGWTGSY